MEPYVVLRSVPHLGLIHEDSELSSVYQFCWRVPNFVVVLSLVSRTIKMSFSTRIRAKAAGKVTDTKPDSTLTMVAVPGRSKCLWTKATQLWAGFAEESSSLGLKSSAVSKIGRRQGIDLVCIFRGVPFVKSTGVLLWLPPCFKQIYWCCSCFTLQLKVFDDIVPPTPKTKDMVQILEEMEHCKKVLFVEETEKVNDSLCRATRNLHYANVIPVKVRYERCYLGSARYCQTGGPSFSLILVFYCR
jgi:hypothetical protein